MTKHRNPTLIEFGHPRRSLCQPLSQPLCRSLCQPLCQPLCRPRVQTRFKQGSDKVQTRFLTRFRQGENLSKQGSTRLNKVEYFPVAPKSDEGGSQIPTAPLDIPAACVRVQSNSDTSESQRDWNHSAHGLRACELPWDNRRAQINSERLESGINLRIELWAITRVQRGPPLNYAKN